MTLAFTTSVAGDNSTLTITDSTDSFDPGVMQDVYDNGSAVIGIQILGVTYDDIDVASYFDGGASGNLIYTITPEMLQIGGVSQFSGSVPDGDWVITYTVVYIISGGGTMIATGTSYLYGTIEELVLLEMAITNLNDWQFDNTFYEAMLVGSWYVYLEAIGKAALLLNTTDFRTALSNLQIMLANRNY